MPKAVKATFCSKTASEGLTSWRRLTPPPAFLQLTF